MRLGRCGIELQYETVLRDGFSQRMPSLSSIALKKRELPLNSPTIQYGFKYSEIGVYALLNFFASFIKETGMSKHLQMLDSRGQLRFSLVMLHGVRINV